MDSLCRLAFFPLLAASAAFPQAFTANLTGLVTDPGQAAVPAASVKLLNRDTQETRQTTTSVEGRYVFSQLLPGSYEISVEAPGFKTTTSGLTLTANQAAEVNLTLQIGQVSESVEITGTVIQLNTQSANQSYTLDRGQILNLPASTRNPFIAVHAMAGVTSMSVANSNNSADQNQARFAFNGGRDMSGLVLIDGVPATSGDWGALLAAPSVESVQEVVVSRNSYDAEFGKSGGGVVSVVTKGGSSEFHGSAFEFLRNDNLDANAWVNNRVGRPRVEFKRHQFGGNLSGPLWKAKKLFFLTSYEHLKEGSPATTLTTVPTDLQRGGNFSETRDANGAVSLIFDPFTTRANPSGAGSIRDAFAGNIIPRSRFDAVGAKTIEFYPRANAVPTNAITQANNFFGSGTAITDNKRMDVRIDWARSEKHTMYGRVTKAWQTRKTPRFFGTGADGGSEGDNPRFHATWGNTFIPNPSWVINVTVGSGRWREEQLPLPLRDDVLGTALGYSPNFVSLWDSPHFPQFSLFGYATLSNGRVLNFPRQTDNLQLNTTRELGEHSLKFGFTGEIVRLNSIDIRSTDFAFDRGMTSGPIAQVSSANSGNAVASLLLGTGVPSGLTGATTTVNNSIKNSVVPATSRRYYGFYVQDVWRMNSRLTINAGLRWEMQRPSTERFNRYNYFDFDAPNPLSQRTGLNLRGGLVFTDADHRFQTAPDNVDLAPRIGIAYKINSRIVARAGYGIFYLMGFGTATQGGPAAGTDGYTVTTNWVNTRGGDGITPQDPLANPYPNGLNRPVGSSLGLLTQTGSDVLAFQRSHPTGYIQNYSFDLQFELSRTAILEVGYSGNGGRKLNYGATPDMNQLPSQYLSLGGALNEQVANPFFGVFPTGVLSGQTVPRHRLLRPYPHFATVELSGDTPGAGSSFNALYVKFNQRLRSGLTLMSSYQFSKAIDNASENQGWIISDTLRDVYNSRLDRSVSGHDVPQSFVTALVWEVPVGKGRQFGATMHPVADAVVGGWEVSAIIRFASGLPQRLVAPNGLGAYGYRILNAQVSDLKNLNVDARTPERWFNTTAATSPAAFTIGNAPRYAPNLRADGTHHADINIAKNFRITERVRAQFRGEMYNFTNTPQFSPPGLTVGAADFGQVNGTRFNDRRNVQLGLKLLF